VICLSRPYGSLHLGVPSPSPLLSRPCFSITTSLPSCLSHMPSHTTMTLPQTSSTTSIFPACDNHNKSPNLMVVSTPRDYLLWPPRAKHELPLLTSRPPSEPPPPNYESLDKIDESITVASLLALIRPPSNSPWSFHGFLSLVHSDMAYAFSFFFLVYVSIFSGLRLHSCCLTKSPKRVMSFGTKYPMYVGNS
jgi:hypothetical protein